MLHAGVRQAGRSGHDKSVVIEKIEIERARCVRAVSDAAEARLDGEQPIEQNPG